MNTKICKTCGIEKELFEFYKDDRYEFGVTASCKKCIKEYTKSYQKINCDSIKEKKKAQYLKNREETLRKNKQYHKEHFDQAREAKLKQNFGITLVQYNQMFQEQNGVCAICGQPELQLDTRNNKVRSLAVDHNHKTGKIRGLLCGSCNKALGGFKDNTNFLESALNYLKKF